MRRPPRSAENGLGSADLVETMWSRAELSRPPDPGDRPASIRVADGVRNRDRARRLRHREARAVDRLDDPGAVADAGHLVPLPVDHVRSCLQLLLAERAAEHARCLPGPVDLDLDLATSARAVSLREHVVIYAVAAREGRRLQPVGDRDRRRPRYQIGGVRDDDRTLGNEAIGGVEVTRNPERDRAADRTVVSVSAAVEGGLAARLVEVPQADHRRGAGSCVQGDPSGVVGRGGESRGREWEQEWEQEQDEQRGGTRWPGGQPGPLARRPLFHRLLPRSQAISAYPWWAQSTRVYLCQHLKQ